MTLHLKYEPAILRFWITHVEYEAGVDVGLDALVNEAILSSQLAPI